MIDTENLAFGQNLADLTVQCFGRFQIIAEGLLKDHAPPMAIFFTGQIRCAEMINDLTKKCWAGSKIKKVIALRVALLVNVSQYISHFGVELRIMKFAAYIEDSLDHPITKLGIDRAGSELIKFVTHDLLVLLTGVIIAANADDREV